MEEKVQALIERAASADLHQLSAVASIDVSLLTRARQGDLTGWTTGMVERLARSAGVDPAAVWAPTALSAPPAVSFLRGSWPDFHHADVPVLTRALEAGCTLRAMAALLVRDIGARFRPGRVACQMPAYEHGYVLARDLRGHLSNPDAAVPDMFDLAGGVLDVHVVTADLRTARLDAVTVYSTEGCAVVLNRRVEQRPVMLRRSLAHELCHALFDEHDAPLSVVLEQDLGADLDTSPKEQRARAFAAELLVPEAGLRRLFGVPTMTVHGSTARELVDTASREFGAPPELVANHLTNHRYVHLDLREWLVTEVAGQEVSVSDVGRDWLGVRIAQAIQFEHISGQRASELLSLFAVGDGLAA